MLYIVNHNNIKNKKNNGNNKQRSTNDHGNSSGDLLYTCPTCRKRGTKQFFVDSIYNKWWFQYSNKKRLFVSQFFIWLYNKNGSAKHLKCLSCDGMDFCTQCNYYSKYHQKLSCDQVKNIMNKPKEYTMCPHCNKIVYNIYYQQNPNKYAVLKCSHCQKRVCFGCEEKNIYGNHHCKRNRRFQRLM